MPSTVTLEGPFFTKDPGKTLRANVRDMNDELAVWMQSEVRGIIESNAESMQFYTGWSDDHTVGRTSSLGGKRWDTWAVVSANTDGMSAEDAIRTKAAAATIERRFHPYRRVKSAIYRSRALLTADLTKGLE